jgi:hypothetical protein
MVAIPAPLAELIGKMMRDIDQASMKREADAAKADPRKHKLSRTFPAGAKLNRVMYPQVKDGRGSWVSFGYMTNRNIAGYYLAFRQVETAKRVKRDMWFASKSKKRVIDKSEARYKAMSAKRAKARKKPT